MGTKTGSSLLDLTGIYAEEDVAEIETALEEKAERDRQQRRDDEIVGGQNVEDLPTGNILRYHRL